MKALVTGATGLLGSHLCLHLCQKGYEVFAAFREESKIKKTEKIFSYYNANSLLFQNIKWIKIDLLNLREIEDALNQEVDVVFHTAALVSFEESDSHKIIQYNFEITENLLNAIQGYNPKIKLVHCSSIAALGKPVHHLGLIDETVQWIDSPNNSPYAISKFKSELSVWRAIEEDLKAIIVNPGIIIGPGFWNEGSGKLFTTILKGFRFFTEGVNGFVDVNDVAKAMIELYTSEIYGQRFILVENNYTYKQIFDLISNGLNKKSPDIKITKPMAEIFWRIEWIRGRVSGKKPLITKETAKSATNQVRYDGSKIIKSINFNYTPIPEVIKKYCQFLLKEKNLI